MHRDRTPVLGLHPTLCIAKPPRRTSEGAKGNQPLKKVVRRTRGSTCGDSAEATAILPMGSSILEVHMYIRMQIIDYDDTALTFFWLPSSGPANIMGWDYFAAQLFWIANFGGKLLFHVPVRQQQYISVLISGAQLLE